MLPITVIVPLSEIRKPWFNSVGLPSIEMNDPSIIVTSEIGENANIKRNKGFIGTGTPYVFFCDDDIELHPKCLQLMYTALENDKEKGYAYCDFECKDHPCNGTYIHKAGVFDPARLRRLNYISTMSLIRTSMFPGFDNSIKRLQDWDVWLTLLRKGIEGVYIPETLFIARYNNKGITIGKEGYLEAEALIRRKHGI
jgi:glycosyltransferase involved in cell wall biosynthesis